MRSPPLDFASLPCQPCASATSCLFCYHRLDFLLCAHIPTFYSAEQTRRLVDTHVEVDTEWCCTHVSPADLDATEAPQQSSSCYLIAQQRAQLRQAGWLDTACEWEGAIATATAVWVKIAVGALQLQHHLKATCYSRRTVS